jgi:hypothetical protein
LRAIKTPNSSTPAASTNLALYSLRKNLRISFPA